MLLSIVYGLITLALVLVIASISHVHIERKRLWNLADALAADAADAADETLWYGTSGTRGLVLTEASVQEAVDEHLQAAPAALTDSFTDLTVAGATTPDGEIAEVSLTALVRPPLVPWVLLPYQDGFTVQVTSRSHATEP